MFSSAGVAPSFASRAAQKASNNITASNFALKRKRDDIIAPRSAPANRGSSDVPKIREVGNISHAFQGQSGVAEKTNTSRTAKLLPNGDMIVLTEGELSLIQHAVHSSKSTVVHIVAEDCAVSD